VAVRIRVRNFGPLKEADLEVKPLTVFVGPNNSGKSTAAMLLYAVGSAVQGRFAQSTRRRWPLAHRRQAQLARRTFAEAWYRAGDNPESIADYYTATRAKLAQLIELALEELANDMVMEIQRCFGETLADLRRHSKGPRACRIDVTSDAPEWSIRIRVSAGKPAEVATKVSFPRMQTTAEVFSWTTRRALADYEVDVESELEFIRDFAPEVLSEVRNAVVSSLWKHSFYLPAERSGILQSHRALASFVVQQSSYVGIRDLNVSQMSGVIADFLSSLIEVDDLAGPVDAPGWLADFLERELLQGKVSLAQDSLGYPEVVYHQGDANYSLSRASSMVSEVAPIVFYLRNIVEAGDLLIIEEPESHLHPSSQVRLAKVLGGVSDAGVGLVLTTHSDYMLAELNNIIRRTFLQHTGAIELTGIESVPEVPASQVAAYLFTPDTKGTAINPLVVDQDGISEEEFNRVAEVLYERGAYLEQLLAEIDAESESDGEA
jgi:predicted ATPase